MNYIMSISAFFDEPQKRKMRKNRKDLFEIMILQVDVDNPFQPENIFHLKTRYIPSYIYESIPIADVMIEKTQVTVDETMVYRVTSFTVRDRTHLTEIIEMLNDEYEIKAK